MGNVKVGMLDKHTAPATLRIANASLWLFALAMEYPYSPGAQTEAFKGLTVILGIMVCIGASGLIGQIASGMILMYTRALAIGEYVRTQDCEGTVAELGLFVTRLRTGRGEEIALPNSVLLANVTRNYSRVTAGSGFVLDTTITIGYDTPWRQVHAMLLQGRNRHPVNLPRTRTVRRANRAVGLLFCLQPRRLCRRREARDSRRSDERPVRVDTGHVQQIRSADHVAELLRRPSKAQNRAGIGMVCAGCDADFVA